GDVPEDAPGLRLDDLLFIAVAVVPGAVIGGRLVPGPASPAATPPEARVVFAPRCGRGGDAQRGLHRADPERRPPRLAPLAGGGRATPALPHRRSQVQPVPGRWRPGGAPGPPTGGRLPPPWAVAGPGPG